MADFTAADWSNVDLPFVPFGGFATALGSVDVDVFAQDVLRMLDFVLTDAIAGLPSPYWQQGRTLFESVFHPRNLNERDLAWLVCMWRKEHPGATEDAFSRALRCMWNILENDPRHAAERLGQFQRFLIQSRGPALYDEANAAMPASAPLQWQEEAAKAQVYNGHKDLIGRLQEAECHLHGRVRLGILDLENGSAEIRPERLGKLDEMFRAWNSEDEMARKAVIMNLVAAQAYGALDVFELNTSDDNTLRAMLTNRNDKDIQPHLMRIDISRVPDEPFGEAGYSDWQLKDGRPCRWLRDWRQALLDVFNGKNGHGVYADMIWGRGRSVRWHGASGLYYLYSGKSIKWSLPINDWRMELMADEGLAEWFKEMVAAEYAPGAKLDYEWHVVINDGNSIHRGLPSDLADDLTPPRVSPGLYFMQDRIYVIVNPGPGRSERNVCLLDDVQNLRDIPACVASKLQELSQELKASAQLEGGASAPQEG